MQKLWIAPDGSYLVRVEQTYSDGSPITLYETYNVADRRGRWQIASESEGKKILAKDAGCAVSDLKVAQGDNR